MDEKQPKILPSTLRSKKRYIVFEVMSETPVTYGEVVAAIKNCMLELLGELSAAKSEIWIIQNLYDEKKQTGIIKCKHDATEVVRAFLSLVQFVGETRSTIRILGVTGTIKSAKTKYLGISEAEKKS